MNLPFTTGQFLDLFGAYNATIWPMQYLLIFRAVAVVAAVVKPARFTALPALVLALLWGWSGLVYHLTFFRTINGAALIFGMLFVIQAAVMGLEARSMVFRFTRSWRGWTGATLVAYALVLYPVISYFVGHRYPETPTFGAPCPLTIFTLGVLLWAESPRWHVAAIPLVWSLIGTSAAVSLGMREDFGLGAAALVYVAAVMAGRSRGEAISGSFAAR